MIYLPYILIFIIAMLNAVMDILAHKFASSVFSKLNPQFWNPNQSWTNKYKGGKKENGRKYPSFFSGLTDSISDAWHIAKLFIIISIVIGFNIGSELNVTNMILCVLIYGAVFKFFYSWALVKNK